MIAIIFWSMLLLVSILTRTIIYTQLMQPGKERAYNDYQEANKFITYLGDQMQKVSEKSKNLNTLLQEITKKLFTHHICVIIALYNTKLLVHFLEICQSKFKDTASPGYKNLKKLEDFGYGCFFRHFQAEQSIFNSLRNGKEFEEEQQNNLYKKHTGQIKRFEELKAVLARWFQLKGLKEDPLPHLGLLSNFIESYCNFHLESSFEEVFLTWLQNECEDLMIELHKQLNIKNSGLCCRVHFRIDESVDSFDSAVNNFIHSNEKNKIIGSEHYKKQLKQCISSFLNSSGGTILLGIEYDSKRATIKGVQMSFQEKQRMIKWLTKEIIFKIFPDPDETPSEDLSAIEKRLLGQEHVVFEQIKPSPHKAYEQYEINDFVSIDFIPVYNSRTFLLSRVNNVLTYVMRIKVKAGNPYEVYHFINDKEIPEATYRQRNKQRVLTFEEYYEELYRKLRLKVKRKQPDPKEEPHKHCRLYQGLPILQKQSRKPRENSEQQFEKAQ